MGDHQGALVRVRCRLDQGMQLADDAALAGQGQAVLAHQGIEHELGQRPRRFDQGLHRGRPFGADKGIRVVAGGQQGHPAGHLLGQQKGHAAQGRLETGGVGVEQQHHLVRVAAQSVQVAAGQGRAERRDHVVDAVHGQQQQVEVTLHHQGAALFPDGLTVGKQAEQQPAFVKDHALRRVQVLGPAVAEKAAAEGHHPPGQVRDREHDPVAEPVVVAAALLAHGQARRLQGLRVQPAGPQPVDEIAPARLLRIGRVAEPVARDGRRRHPPLFQVGPGRGRVPLLAETPLIHRRGRLVGLVERLSPAQLFLLGLGQLPLRQIDVELPGKEFERLGKFQVMVLHHKGEHVPGLAAAEAVVELPLGVDREGGGLLRVEGTQAGVACARPLQLHVLADHLDDVGHLADGLLHLFAGGGHAHGCPPGSPGAAAQARAGSSWQLLFWRGPAMMGVFTGNMGILAGTGRAVAAPSAATRKGSRSCRTSIRFWPWK